MLVIGVVLLFIGAGVAIYGNHLNNDLSSQMEALCYGRLNPGDFAVSLGWVILGAGALCAMRHGIRTGCGILLKMQEGEIV